MSNPDPLPGYSAMCPLCQAAYTEGRPANFGSDPQCAFPSGAFDGNNWQCMTALALRDLCGREGAVVYSDDANAALLPVDVRGPEEPDADGDLYAERIATHLLLTWYKQRGRQAGAWLLFCEAPPVPLTLDAAIQILAQYQPKPRTPKVVAHAR